MKRFFGALLLVGICLTLSAQLLPTRRRLFASSGSGGGGGPSGNSGPPVFATLLATNASTGSFSAVTNSVTVSGLNPLLVIDYTCYDNASGHDKVSAVSFNGAGGSIVGETNWFDTTGGSHGMWYIQAPSVTTANLIVTFSGAVSEVELSILLYTNAAQSSVLFGAPTLTFISADGAGVTNTIASITTNMVVIAGYGSEVAGSLTYSSSETERGQSLQSSHSQERVTDKPGTAGTVTMSTTISGADKWTQVIGAFQGK